MGRFRERGKSIPTTLCHPSVQHAVVTHPTTTEIGRQNPSPKRWGSSADAVNQFTQHLAIYPFSMPR